MRQLHMPKADRLKDRKPVNRWLHRNNFSAALFSASREPVRCLHARFVAQQPAPPGIQPGIQTDARR